MTYSPLEVKLDHGREQAKYPQQWRAEQETPKYYSLWSTAGYLLKNGSVNIASYVMVLIHLKNN